MYTHTHIHQAQLLLSASNREQWSLLTDKDEADLQTDKDSNPDFNLDSDLGSDPDSGAVASARASVGRSVSAAAAAWAATNRMSCRTCKSGPGKCRHRGSPGHMQRKPRAAARASASTNKSIVPPPPPPLPAPSAYPKAGDGQSSIEQQSASGSRKR